MHSSLVRLQNTFGFFTSVAFALAVVVGLSSLLFPTSPTAEISVRNVQVVKGRPHYYSPKKEEYAHIKFDLEADFTSLFNWNTKQLFVWVMATYPSLTPGDPPSQAIIWDLIINSPAQLNTPWSVDNFRSYLPAFLQNAKKSSKASKIRSGAKAAAAKVKKAVAGDDQDLPGKISLRNVKPKYQITDVSGLLAERGNVTLEVGWNVQPWFGALAWTLPEGSSFLNWKGVLGGRSKAFDMPPLKSKKTETVGVKDGQPKAGKVEPVV